MMQITKTKSKQALKSVLQESMALIPVKGLVCVITTMVLSCSLAFAQGTTVYKTVNPDGSVTYSDQPSGYAERMEVQPVPTIPALKVPRSSSMSSSKTDRKVGGAYTSLTILAPGHDSAFYSGNGDVNVSVQLEPALKGGHQFRFSLDGRVMASQASSTVTLMTVDRGTHSLSVAVIDEAGNVLLSNSSTFTVHRPTVNRP